MADLETSQVEDPEFQTSPEFYDLRLYVAGKTAKSINAFANLKTLCEEYLAFRVRCVATIKVP